MTNPDVVQRVEPAHVFPLLNGRYQVKVGLSRLGTDWGNGRADRHAFQLISNGPAIGRRSCRRAQKIWRSTTQPTTRLSPRGRSALAEWMILRLYKEHHEQFRWERHDDQTWWVHCQLSGETIELDRNRELSGVRNGPLPDYADTLDALAFQEDIALP